MLQAVNDCEHCLRLLDVFYTKDETAVKKGAKTGIIQNLVFEYFPCNLEELIDCESRPHSLKFARL